MTISIASEDEPYRHVVASGVAVLSAERALEGGGIIAARYRGEVGPAFSFKPSVPGNGGLPIVTLSPESGSWGHRVMRRTILRFLRYSRT